MDKWTGIAVVAMFVMIFGGMAVKESMQVNANIEMAKAGLEECPKEIGSFHTMWVKDCIAYTKLQKEK